MKRKILIIALAIICVSHNLKAEKNRQANFNAIEANETINLNIKNVSLEKVFKLIESQVNKNFIYRSDGAFLKQDVSININNATLEEALEQRYSLKWR